MAFPATGTSRRQFAKLHTSCLVLCQSVSPLCLSKLHFDGFTVRRHTRSCAQHPSPTSNIVPTCLAIDRRIVTVRNNQDSAQLAPVVPTATTRQARRRGCHNMRKVNADQGQRRIHESVARIVRRAATDRRTVTVCYQILQRTRPMTTTLGDVSPCISDGTRSPTSPPGCSAGTIPNRWRSGLRNRPITQQWQFSGP